MTKKNWNSDKPTQIKLLKATEVAEILNISRSLAYKLLKNRTIPTVRVGTAIRVRPADLNNYIRENLNSANNSGVK